MQSPPRVSFSQRSLRVSSFALYYPRTVVLPVPLSPAMEVISPYLKPPSKATSSISMQPELAGRGSLIAWDLAIDSRVEPRSPGAAGWVSSSVIVRLHVRYECASQVRRKFAKRFFEMWRCAVESVGRVR